MKETKNQGNTFLRENKRKNVQNFDFYGIKTVIYCSVSFQNIQMVVFYFFIKPSVLYSSFEKKIRSFMIFPLLEYRGFVKMK